MQEEPLDNKYKYYVVNYSKEEVENTLTNNGFEILESVEELRSNKSDIAVILAKKI